MNRKLHLNPWRWLCFLALLLPLTVNADTITTVAGNGNYGDSGDDGSATLATIKQIDGIAVDNSYNIYIADTQNNRIRKIDAVTGIISTIAGDKTKTAGFSGDGDLATKAQLKSPSSVAIDANGNIYISDSGNYRIRRIDAITKNINTVAGYGNSYFYPHGIAIYNNTLYAADNFNHVIWKVDNISGIGSFSRIAGDWGVSGHTGDDGLAIDATLDSPNDVAISTSGDIYIVNSNNTVIRKIDKPTGIITTIAGKNNDPGYNGDNISAKDANLSSPYGIAIDNSNNIYIADTGNNRIRKVTPTGIISTVAGDGSHGSGGNNVDATTAQFAYPRGIEVDNIGNLYIADTGNYLVRKVTMDIINSNFSLLANKWRFFGLPLNPGATNTVQGIFGDDLNTANYGTRWTVYGRTTAGDGTYYSLNLTDTLTNGEGYWILSLDAATVDMDGTAIATVDNKVEANLPKAAVNLSRNVPVAYPFTTAQPWTNVTQIKMVNGSVGASEVTANSSATGFMYNGSSYVAGNLWTYNGTSYVAGKPTMNPWDAFWAYLRDPAYIHLNNNGNMKLLLPKP